MIRKGQGRELQRRSVRADRETGTNRITWKRESRSGQQALAMPKEEVRLSAGTMLVGDSPVLSSGLTHADNAAITTVVNVEGRTENMENTPVLRDESAVTAILFQREQAPAPVFIEQLPALVQDDRNFVWIDLVNYTEGQLREISTLLGLHRSALHAALSPWHRPWLAVYPNHFYMSATVARLDSDSYRIHAGELDLFIGNNFLVSAHKLPLPFAEQLVTRVRQSPELLTLDAAYMLFIVLDELLSYYEELNRAVQEETALLEERALRDSSDRFLEDILRFKRYAFALFGLVDQHRDVFSAFLRPDFDGVRGEEVEPYFRDLQDRLARLLEALLTAKEAVNGAFEIYVSHLSFRSNQVIKTLTIVSTILFTATLLVAVFGTTIQGLVPGHALVWFGLELVSMIGISGAIFVVFRRQGWI